MLFGKNSGTTARNQFKFLSKKFKKADCWDFSGIKLPLMDEEYEMLFCACIFDEGFERNLLRGAMETLRRFAPKIAICTYHLPDDPEVLEAMIKEADPAYRVVHMPQILFADAR